ncbi:MAG: hypothetical protein LBG64_00450 [Pseudomonadales bacterium]|nr:hypothetical protein [Pseudomonadales bacterium]
MKIENLQIIAERLKIGGNIMPYNELYDAINFALSNIATASFSEGMIRIFNWAIRIVPIAYCASKIYGETNKANIISEMCKAFFVFVMLLLLLTIAINLQGIAHRSDLILYFIRVSY